MDVLFLSRLQFALTVMFHYLFPPLTIGLGLVIVYLLAMHLRTGEPIYESAARFWTGIFGLTFAMGVGTGIVMEFEFGTNWAAYSRYVGDVFGSALAAEGVFAFFLESGFLAVLLFGWERVSARFHFVAATMVFLGSIFSSVWIVVANSWQQTPTGFVLRTHEVNGHLVQRAEITNFWAMVFNPSSIPRLVHVWFGAFILGAFFVMSISAWYLLRGRHPEFAKRSFSGALVLAAIFSVAQLVSGDVEARLVAVHQPAKLAAAEALYRSQPYAPLHLFGWPDDAKQRVEYGVAIPGLLSFLVHHDTSQPVAGLDDLEDLWGTPPVWIVFEAFHLMVGIGMLFIGASLFACLLRWRGTLFEKRWLLWFFVLAVPLAFLANELGWVTAEVGRQPWVVYPTLVNGHLVGGLRTSQGLSRSVGADQVLGSLLMFGVLYALLFAVWLTLLNQKIQEGPEPVAGVAEGTRVGDVFETAARRTGHSGSVTEARSEAERGR